MPSQYDPYAVDYDPFAVGAYQRYVPQEPPAPPAFQPPAPVAPTVQAPALVPFDTFMASQTDKAKGYAEYVGSLLPRYMTGLGLSPEQQTFELEQFKAQRPAPAPTSAFDRFDERVGARLPKLDRTPYIDQAGLADVRAQQAKDQAIIEQRRKEFGVEDANWFKSAWDAMASGLANAYGAPAEYLGRNLGLKFLEESGRDARLEAAALMKVDPSFKDKLFNAGGSALGYAGTAVAGAGGAAAAGLGALSRVAVGALVSGLPEGAGVAQEAYDTALRNTGNKDQAEAQAFKALLINVPLSTIANKIVFFGLGKGGNGGVVATLARGAITNGAEEGAQQLLTNYLGYEENTAKGLAENITLGALVGGPVSLLMHGGTKVAQEVNPKAAESTADAPTDETLKQILDGIPQPDEGGAVETTAAVVPAPETTTAPTSTDSITDITQQLQDTADASATPAQTQTPGLPQASLPATAVPAPSPVVTPSAPVQATQPEGATHSAEVIPAVAQTQAPVATAPVAPDIVQVAPVLPQILAGAKPRYSNAPLTFASDVDRALYIVRSTKRMSNKDTDYLTWLQKEVFPQESSGQIRGRGDVIAASIKPLYDGGKSRLVVPAYHGTDASVADTLAGNAADASAIVEESPEAIQVLDALQVPDDPALTAAEVDAAIASFEDEANTAPNASQKAAFVAAEVEGTNDGRPQPPQFITTSIKRTREPRAAGDAAQADSSLQAVQPDLPGQPGERGASAGGREGVSAGDVAAGRAEVLVDPEDQQDNRRPMGEAQVKRIWEELSVLKHPEARELADYFYKEYDQGFGSPRVDMAKVARYRALHAEVRAAKKLRQQGVDEATLRELTDPGTGEEYDSRVAVNHFAAERLPESVTQMLLGGNLRGALEKLYERGSTPLIRATAGRLASVDLSRVKVKIEPLAKDAQGRRTNGRWDQKTLVLRLDGVHGMNEHTLLHEAAHAATVTILRDPQTKAQQAAIRELESIMFQAKRVLGEGEYAFTNTAEFVAEAMSNPEFQAQLYQIKAERSLWQRFVSAILSLTGLDNLLGRTMNVAEALMMAPVAAEDGPSLNVVAPKGAPAVSVERTGDFYTWVFDSQAPVLHFGKQVERALKAIGVVLPDSINVRLQNVLKRSRAEAAIRKWEEGHWKKIAEDVRKARQVHGRPVEDVETFLEQLQALGRAQANLKDLDPTNASFQKQSVDLQAVVLKADKYLRSIEQSAPAYFRDMTALATKIKAATDSTLDERLAADNNMTSQRLAGLKAAFPSRYMPGGFYIPLQLDGHDGTEVAVLKQALGKNFSADKPLARIYAQAALTAYSNESNTEKQQILALARLYDIKDAHTGKPLIEIAPIPQLKRDKHTGQITEGIDSLTLDQDSVGVWVKGAFVKMRVRDPALREALRPIQPGNTPQSIGLAIGVARHFNQLMSAVRTSLNPGFAIFNYLRDTAAVAVQLDPRINYSSFVAAMPGAMYSAFKNVYADAFGGKSDARFRKALDAGAFISQRSYIGLIDTVHDVQFDLAPTIGKRLKKFAADPLTSPLGKVLAAFSQSLETATRLAVYDAAIASKMTPKEAAYQAKTTTVNFERKSALTNAVGPFFMFVNAKAQGMRTFGDKLVGIDANPRTQGAVGAMVALGLIAAMIGYKESEKDKDGISKYFKIADYKRDRLVVFKEGSAGLPLPQEASLFYILGNAIGDVVWGPSSPGEALTRLVKNIVQQLSPLGAAQTDPVSSKTNVADYIMRLFLPTTLQPAYDLATNRDTFGRPIVSESLRFRGKKDFEKYTRNENANSIAAAKTLYEGGFADVSPATLTYFAKYLEGGSITFWRTLFDQPKPAFEGQATGALSRRFIAEAAPYGDEVAYRDALERLEGVAARAKQGTMSERGKAYQENRDALALLNQFKAFEEYKTRTLFKGYGSMPDAQYERARQQANDRMLALMKRYYELESRTK